MNDISLDEDTIMLEVLEDKKVWISSLSAILSNPEVITAGDTIENMVRYAGGLADKSVDRFRESFPYEGDED